MTILRLPRVPVLALVLSLIVVAALAPDGAWADSVVRYCTSAGSPCVDVVWPASPTAGQVTGGGTTFNPGADEIVFGLTAQTLSSGPLGLPTGFTGRCSVIDPEFDVHIKCLDVLAVAVVGNTATITGNATINDMPTQYVIEVVDVREPGAGVGGDAFRIKTTSGYSAGLYLLTGNIRIHR